MRPEFQHLFATPAASLSSFSWPVLPLMPLVGYSLDSWHGMLLGGVVSAGMLSAVPVLASVYEAAWWLHQQRQSRRRARCPGCLRVLDGRRACQCGQELTPLSYLLPWLATGKCPHCGESINGRPISCLTADCSERRDAGEFGSVRGWTALMIVKQEDLAEATLPERALPFGTRCSVSGAQVGVRLTECIGKLSAAKLYWIEDTQFTIDVVPERARQALELVWVARDANVNARENLKALTAKVEQEDERSREKLQQLVRDKCG